jgi:hypothetical protein
MPSIEIIIKGWDLISAKGYFQSNHGRWRTSGQPTMLDRVVTAWCSWRGQSSPELRATRLWCSIFGGFSSYGIGRVRGTHLGGFQPLGSSGAGRVAARLKLQGMAHDKVGQNGCGIGWRTPTLGWWSSRSVARGAAMKGANQLFAPVFFKILAQGPSIYRGSESMISCVCRTPSASFPIRQGFGFDRLPLRFRLGTTTLGSVCYLVWGRTWSSMGHAREKLG